jgi:hypothetical protein
MTETTLVKLAGKGATRLTRWLDKATKREKNGHRQVLECLHHERGITYASDGHRLLATPTPNGLEPSEDIGDTVYIVNLPASATVAEITEPQDVGKYPDVASIVSRFPKSPDDPQNPKTPTLEINVSAKLLRETLAGFTNKDEDRVTLRFWTNETPYEVLGRIEGQPAFAMIMPVRNGNDNAPLHTWRPGEKGV